eukprot:8370162-Lingulodinium_polyedra.AAC.1
MVAGGTVICYSAKTTSKYDERTSSVQRLNSRQAASTMLDGPVRGEKRKADYKMLNICPPRTNVCREVFRTSAS